MVFRLLWIFDALVAAVFVYFFLAGLAAGTVSSFNLGLWLATLGFFAAVLAGSWWLRAKNWPRAALIVLSVPALPSLAYLLLILAFLIAQPDWR